MNKRPNIVVIYADDLGFGDVGCYGGNAIPTPNIDRLAREGLRFHNGYATAATCTPSRYSLLTGSYPWRNSRAAILPGDAAQIIPSNSPTLPALLRQAGYATGVVGKWHLGLGDGNIDWNVEIDGTPLDVGFDSSYIMAATNDRVPCVYVDGRRVAHLDPADPIEVFYGRDNPFPGVPTGRDNPDRLRLKHSHSHDDTIVNGVGRIGFMRGGKAALWTDETMADTFARRAVEFVGNHKAQPFFLYYALHQPHVPRLPGPRFAGTTGLGARGDVIAELDACVGELLDALDANGLRDNTLVVFSSDNGPVLDDGYQDRAEALTGDHRPMGPLRGGKYSLYDGGTRVPFILRWPGTIAAGTESDAVVCHVDFMASFARLVGVDLPDAAAPDSEDVLDALLGRCAAGREELVTEGMQGGTVLRQGDWVYIPPHDGPAVSCTTHIEMGNAPEAQLYHLIDDVGQCVNLATAHPDRVARMRERLDALCACAGTRKGALR